MKALFTVLMILSLAFSAVCAEAQAAKVHQIGYLAAGAVTAGTHAFLKGLRELGYIEGQTFIIEYRFAEGTEDRLAGLAADLVRLNVHVIVVGGSAAARAAQQQTRTIPIVLADSADPVAAGLVASLSRPGGNITGLTIMSPQLGGKSWSC
jgi:putative ABC transport system substrate-binding protein